MRYCAGLLTTFFALGASAAGHAQDVTTPGETSAPYPTAHALSLEWAIEGDDDADGTVTVRYREAGGGWQDGLPLFRVPSGSNEGHSWANRHAGSLFDLRPDTEYEIELMLEDPDGGAETRTLTARTRRIPVAPDDATVVEVTPDTFTAALSAASPGDIILLGPGTYGGFTVGVDGTEDQPLVVRGASADEVTVTGDVRMDGRSHVYLEDVTALGMVKFNGAEGVVVRGCTIQTDQHGIVSIGAGSTHGYFVDNVLLGPTTWYDGALGVSGDNLGEGILLTGPGNVVAYNRVVGFRDNISLMEGDAATDQFSIDIFGNEIDGGADDCIEADFAMGNVRVYRNRLTNCFMGISSQPGLGGPTYLVRNAMYNVIYSPFKLQRNSVGDVVLHNTVVKSGDAFAIYTSAVWERAYVRNNLFLGGEGGGTYGGYDNGPGRVTALSSVGDTCTFDYDGYGSIGTGTFQGYIGDDSFSSLAEMRAATTEEHAVEVDMSVFAADVSFPSSGPFPGLDPQDLRLEDGSAAVDQGLALTGINDGFAGSGPDLGAYEAGSLLPPYGPRAEGASACGNGVIEAGEECDDANTASGDGCASDCTVETDGETDGGVRGSDGGPATGDDGGTPGTDGGPPTGPADDTEMSGGCSCRVSGTRTPAGGALLGGAVLFAALGRRRSRRR